MEGFPLFQTRCLTVSTLTQHVKMLLESDEILQDVWVEGEISNLSRPSSGHVYFTLKDPWSSLGCVIWRNTAQRLRGMLQEGGLIQAHGTISVYEAGGKYQLYIDIVRPAGEGALFQEFLRLKALLEAEGLFDAERKRPIPAWPKRIGIVTSPTGAALQDMLNIFRHRFPLAEVVLAPASVQGLEAPPSLVAAIQALNRCAQPDVILVARGGGSIEDLWAFNDERVIRAICASQAPVICGIGHETDYTLCDFACDLRAPTPTGAAMLCTPDQAELRQQLLERQLALIRQAEAKIENESWQLRGLQRQLQRSSPVNQILNQRQRLDDTLRGMHQAAGHLFALERACLEGMQLRLANLSPQAVLQRGYAIVTHHPSGGLVYSTKQAKTGEELAVRLADGRFTVQVTHNLQEPSRHPDGTGTTHAVEKSDKNRGPRGEERDA